MTLNSSFLFVKTLGFGDNTKKDLSVIIKYKGKKRPTRESLDKDK